MSDATPSEILVAAFYRFAAVPDPASLRADLAVECREAGLKGTVLVAEEGLNGTVAGEPEAIAALRRWLLARPEFDALEWKQSGSPEQPFHRMKVRLKREIVTLGVPDVDAAHAGTYVEPQDWNRLIRDPSVAVIDTRNRYETALGRFQGAIDPGTDSFRDFPAWAEANLDPARQRRVALYCTGGIRCEKATALLRRAGFEAVYHLHGGILNYLERVPRDHSLWHGECFVFDNRVTVDHELRPGDHEICFSCRMPLTEADRASPDYEKHVSCPHCIDRLDERRRASLIERARQVELAAQRGEAHIGRVFESSEERS